MTKEFQIEGSSGLIIEDNMRIIDLGNNLHKIVIAEENADKEVFFIREKGTEKPLTFKIKSLQSQDCNDYEAQLSDCAVEGEDSWYAASEEHALLILNKSADWYNSDIFNPTHKLDTSKYEVVTRINYENTVSTMDFEELSIRVIKSHYSDLTEDDTHLKGWIERIKSRESFIDVTQLYDYLGINIYGGDYDDILNLECEFRERD